MPWYVISQGGTYTAGTFVPKNLTVKQATNGSQNVAAGPFANEVRAENWAASHNKQSGGGGGSAGGGSTSPWWIVYVILTNGSQATPHIIQRPGEPPAGSKAAGGTIEWTYGPYNTKAAARQALNGKGNLLNKPPVSAPQPPAPLSGLASVGDLASRLTDPNTWARAGEVVIGSLVLIVGVYVLVKDTKTGKSVIKKTKSAASVATKAAVL